jgi:hypothetical protein
MKNCVHGDITPLELRAVLSFFSIWQPQLVQAQAQLVLTQLQWNKSVPRWKRYLRSQKLSYRYEKRLSRCRSRSKRRLNEGIAMRS